MVIYSITKLDNVSIERLSGIIQPKQTAMIKAESISLDISDVIEVRGYGDSDWYANGVVLKEFV